MPSEQVEPATPVTIFATWLPEYVGCCKPIHPPCSGNQCKQRRTPTGKFHSQAVRPEMESQGRSLTMGLTTRQLQTMLKQEQQEQSSRMQHKTGRQKR